MEVIQLTAQYGSNVDSGSADETAAMWTDDGVPDAVDARRARASGHARAETR